MRRNAVLVAGALAGAGAAFLLGRRRGVRDAPPADPRAEELRRRLAEARSTAAEEDDFEAAGMAAETVVEDEPRGPDAEFREMRRRVHREAREAADEMKRREPEEG